MFRRAILLLSLAGLYVLARKLAVEGRALAASVEADAEAQDRWAAEGGSIT